MHRTLSTNPGQPTLFEFALSNKATDKKQTKSPSITTNLKVHDPLL